MARTMSWCHVLWYTYQPTRLSIYQALHHMDLIPILDQCSYHAYRNRLSQIGFWYLSELASWFHPFPLGVHFGRSCFLFRLLIFLVCLFWKAIFWTLSVFPFFFLFLSKNHVCCDVYWLLHWLICNVICKEDATLLLWFLLAEIPRGLYSIPHESLK